MGGFSFKALKGLARIPTQQEADLNALSGKDYAHVSAPLNGQSPAAADILHTFDVVLQGGASS